MLHISYADIDECDSNPCQNNGNCIDEINGYQCNCTGSFAGDECEIEVECDPNPTTGNTTISADSGDLTSPTLGSFATFTCYSGHKFPDLTTSKTVECVAGGWNETLAACVRMYIFNIPTSILGFDHHCDTTRVRGKWLTIIYVCRQVTAHPGLR